MDERRDQSGQRMDERREQSGQREGGGDGRSVSLSNDQRTRIRETVITRSSEARIDNPTFQVRVGTRIPTEIRTRAVVLPPDIVTIVPQYRGYRYIVVHDEVVILDPDTLEIIAIIPA
ncbi:MAG TPA: DUF1236 domain-containing protein [Xanthobacteraceae bacterium]|jgi:hypothetical protein|nr:DUF1236 domain-containing protein [Xanthobacteraceae bacterium]